MCQTTFILQLLALTSCTLTYLLITYTYSLSLAHGKRKKKEKKKNHSTQDSRVVPHRGTNWAALWLTAQIGRDAVLSKSYGRGYQQTLIPAFVAHGLHTAVKQFLLCPLC